MTLLLSKLGADFPTGQAGESVREVRDLWGEIQDHDLARRRGDYDLQSNCDDALNDLREGLDAMQRGFDAERKRLASTVETLNAELSVVHGQLAVANEQLSDSAALSGLPLQSSEEQVPSALENVGLLMRKCEDAARTLRDSLRSGTEGEQAATTLGLLLDGCEIEHLVTGAPAFNSGLLERGDLVEAIDGIPGALTATTRPASPARVRRTLSPHPRSFQRRPAARAGASHRVRRAGLGGNAVSAQARGWIRRGGAAAYPSPERSGSAPRTKNDGAPLSVATAASFARTISTMISQCDGALSCP
jgi:hypothetical protein